MMPVIGLGTYQAFDVGASEPERAPLRDVMSMFVARQIEEPMELLGAGPIDPMQIHNLLDADTHMQTLRELKDRKRIRYIGVTHYTASGAEAIARFIERVSVDFIQINYSIGEREAERRLLPMALDQGVAVIANRPFAAGNLFARLAALVARGQRRWFTSAGSTFGREADRAS